MKKDESYIKNLLTELFNNVGSFQQFEFSAQGMAHRPDFVILENSKFTYFEIKSEYDSLARLENQIKESRYLFSHMFLVAPLKHLEKAEASIPMFKLYCGTYALEELEKGNTEPRTRQLLPSAIHIEAVLNILWSDEIVSYTKDAEISINGKYWTKKEKKDNKRKLFPLLYNDRDSLRILNEVLPNRYWANREMRSAKQKLKTN